MTSSNTEVRVGPSIILYTDGVPMPYVIPGKPEALQATKITDNSIELKWTKPEEGVIESYDVNYRSNGASELRPVTGTNITIDGLSPDTVYTFFVQAVSIAGVSVESQMLFK